MKQANGRSVSARKAHRREVRHERREGNRKVWNLSLDTEMTCGITCRQQDELFGNRVVLGEFKNPLAEAFRAVGK